MKCQYASKQTYILLPNQHLHRPPLRHDLRNIAQPHLRAAALVRLHAQVLQQLRVEPPAGSQLRQVIFQALDGGCDVCFQGGEIGRVVCRRGIFLRSGLRFGFVAGCFAAFLEEGGGGGEGAAVVGLEGVVSRLVLGC